jgi:hypothetical protein
VYLFQPRPRQPAASDAPATDPEAAPLVSAPPIEAGAAASWALGELLIRLCNRGKALQPEPPEKPDPQ